MYSASNFLLIKIWLNCRRWPGNVPVKQMRPSWAMLAGCDHNPENVKRAGERYAY